jgi:phosphoenolpyruvate phosphomutase
MTARRLRELLDSPGKLVKLAGAHNALRARLAEAAGFDAVWASSLEISASHGVPDAGILGLNDLLAAAAEMVQAVSVPVVADCDTGFGNEVNVTWMVRRYEAAGVAAVCIADARFPKVNSLLAAGHHLAPVEEFVAKLHAARLARRSPDFFLIARVEALIAGAGQAEALARARAYHDAGADAVLIHSRSPAPDEVLDFVAAWDRPTPLVVVPTTYHSLGDRDLRASGKVRLVIYANHGLRASIRAMQQVFRQILQEGTTHQAEQWISSLEEVFELQGLAPSRPPAEARDR